MPILSVIVPVYNVEKYIHQCIDSILSQTFKDFELILVDDGSSDKCGEFCDEYESQDSRIKVIHKVNGGISSARNIGIMYASGEYISFIDSDDYIDKTMFSKLMTEITSKDLDVVKCGYIEFNNASIKGKKVSYGTSLFRGDTLISFSMNGVFFTVVWNAVYRKDIVEKVMFPVGIINEDVYFSGMLLYYAKKIGLVDDALYFYRYNPNSITKKKVIISKSLDSLVSLSMLHEELLKNNFNDKKILSYIKRRMAGRLYGVMKRTAYNVKMSREFYNLMCSNLSGLRRIKMFFYKLRGRITLVD